MMSEQRRQVEMKNMQTSNRSADHEEEEEEETGSEYTDGSDDEGTDDSEDSSSDEEEKKTEPDEKNDTKVEEEEEKKKKKGNDIDGKTVGLLIERPQGWTTRGAIPSKLGFRKSRGCVLTLNTLLCILCVSALQVSCLYRDMCSNSDDPTVPKVVGLSIVPLCLIGIFLVCPVGAWSAVSRVSSSKIWFFHLFISLSFAVALIAMIITGAVEYLDMLEVRPCILETDTSANCTGFDELSSTQKSRFENDKSTFETEINRNGAAIGVFGCLGCLICILDVFVSVCVICSGRKDENFDDECMMDLPTDDDTHAAAANNETKE